MLDWLLPTGDVDGPRTPYDLFIRLGMALIFGALVALAYRLSHGREKNDSRTLITTLVLLSVLIAMVSMVIGNSVARAFSLVGALSIVRFRTVVDDTRDTAFVIFAVIVGMAAGAGLTLVAVIGIPMVSAAAILLSRMGGSSDSGAAADCTLTVRLALGRDPDLVLATTLARYVAERRTTAVQTAKQGSALELTYQIRLRSDDKMTDLVAELNQVEGVQAVDLKRS